MALPKQSVKIPPKFKTKGAPPPKGKNRGDLKDPKK